MAHKVKIGGTNYEVTGGRTLIGATGYDVSDGNTKIAATGYDLGFGSTILVRCVGTPSYYGTYSLNTNLRMAVAVSVRSNGQLLNWAAGGAMNGVNSRYPLKITISGELYDLNGNFVGPLPGLSIYHQSQCLASGDDVVSADFPLTSASYRIVYQNGQEVDIIDGYV